MPSWKRNTLRPVKHSVGKSQIFVRLMVFLGFVYGISLLLLHTKVDDTFRASRHSRGGRRHSSSESTTGNVPLLDSHLARKLEKLQVTIQEQEKDDVLVQSCRSWRVCDQEECVWLWQGVRRGKQWWHRSKACRFLALICEPRSRPPSPDGA